MGGVKSLVILITLIVIVIALSLSSITQAVAVPESIAAGSVSEDKCSTSNSSQVQVSELL